jgi:hypothetical protein
MTRLVAALILMLATAVPAAAQEAAEIRTLAGKKIVNVKFELTITDHTATGSPLKKSIMWVLADGFQSRVRSTGVVHQQEKSGNGPDGPPMVFTRPLFEVELNVDSAVQVLEADTLRAEFTIQYTPGIAGSIAPSGTVKPSPLNESVTVILRSGKPLVITQAADPVSDRKIDVQVTATIVR